MYVSDYDFSRSSDSFLVNQLKTPLLTDKTILVDI